MIATLRWVEVRIYGAFRSGTNYVKTLLEVNYDTWIRSRGGGFKHAPVPALFVGSAGWVRPPEPVIGVVKDPWSWLPSAWRYASGPGSNNFDCAGTWEAFIRSPIWVYSGAFEGFPKYWYRTPVDYWIAMAASMSSSGNSVLRYEDVLDAPERACSVLAEKLGLKRTTKDFVAPMTTTKRGGDERQVRLEDYVTDVVFDKSYYQNREYMDWYSPEERADVTELLSIDVVLALGYSPNC